MRARPGTEAGAIGEEDVPVNDAIGRHGLPLLQAVAARRPGPVNVLTHCNAGWLATVDWGTALAPIYQAHAAGLPLHWSGWTRPGPRNQGASLTAWELAAERRAAPADRRQCRRPPDAARPGGPVHRRLRPDHRHRRCLQQDRHLSQGAGGARQRRAVLRGHADLDAGPGRWPTACARFPIEERSAREVTHISGRDAAGAVVEVQLTAAGTPAANPAFDVTPARLVNGLITEHGVVAAEEGALRRLMEGQR